MAPADLDALLARRRSTKRFSARPLALHALASLVQAVFHADEGRHTYASAHARYPVAASLVVGGVDGLEQGTFGLTGGSLDRLDDEDHRAALAAASLDAPWLAACPALIVLTADLAVENEAFAAQGPAQGERFVAMEAGMIAQSVHLAAEDRSLGTVLIAGIDRVRAHQIPSSVVPSGHELLGIMPIGHPA
ncbi:nitroreductase family protein [Microbacterium suaedae]|uniref:nitroreductase family protein n=1 Tax=Microbacterium suaedae TaxID=2067813 RepID=UPI000DA200D0|nr:nitroreductase family protein [Microbacterium suaedae]